MSVQPKQGQSSLSDVNPQDKPDPQKKFVVIKKGSDEDILRSAQTAAAGGGAPPPDADDDKKDDDEHEGDTSNDEEDESEHSEDSSDEDATEAVKAKTKPKNEKTEAEDESELMKALMRTQRLQEWVTQKRWKNMRNQREAVTIAASLDALGAAQVKKTNSAVKILIARLQAVRLADFAKSWDVAQHLEQVPLPGTELVSDAKLRKALKRSTLYKKSIGRNPKAKDEEEDE